MERDPICRPLRIADGRLGEWIAQFTRIQRGAELFLQPHHFVDFHRRQLGRRPANDAVNPRSKDRGSDAYPEQRRRMDDGAVKHPLAEDRHEHQHRQQQPGPRPRLQENPQHQLVSDGQNMLVQLGPY